MKTRIIIFLMSFILKLSYGQEPSASFYSLDSSGCAPFSVAFVNTSTNAVSFLWDFGNGNTSTLTNPVSIYSSQGAYTVRLIATNIEGKKDTVVYQNHINVVPGPTADFTVVSDVMCPIFDTLEITNLSTNASNYTWDFGDGIVFSGNNPSHVYSSSGMKNITLIASNNYGCSNTKTIQSAVNVLIQPNAAFSIDKTKVCGTNQSITFTPNYLNGQTYLWNFGDGETASVKVPAHTYNAASIYQASLTVTNPNGCRNTFINENLITIHDLPEVDFTVNDSSGCPGAKITFTNQTPNTASVSWNFGVNNNVNTNPKPTYTYQNSGTYSPRLTVVDVNGCANTIKKDNLIHIFETEDIDFVADVYSGCVPLTVNFTSLAPHAASYNWALGAGQTSASSNPTAIYNTKGNRTITLTVIDSMGCKSVLKKEQYIYAEKPEADIFISDSIGCAPFTVSFDENLQVSSSWFWDFGDGNTSTEKTPTHTYEFSGEYSITASIQTNEGCTDTVIIPSIIYAREPSVNYTTPSPIESCGEITVSFNGTSLGQNFWYWDFGDGTTSDSPNPVHTFSTAGTYSVSLTSFDSYGCQYTISNYNTYTINNSIEKFDYQVDCESMQVHFTDTASNGVKWFWDFGDGETDTVQNPTHIYPKIGIYMVNVTVWTNQGCVISYTSMISQIKCLLNTEDTTSTENNSPVVMIEVDSVFVIPSISYGSDSTQTDSIIRYCAPYVVNFSNPFDDDISSIFWDFGDGNTSTEKNPTHTYSTAGVFSLNLVVQIQEETFTFYCENFIATDVVYANFTTDVNKLCTSYSASFFDTTHNASAYHWNFGDGTSSYSSNPSHIYTQNGNYLVNFEASNEFGCKASVSKNITIGISNPIFYYNKNACLAEKINFSSNIQGNYIIQWNFGDGTSAFGNQAFHSYLENGTFSVSVYLFDSLSLDCVDTLYLQQPIKINSPKSEFVINGKNEGCEKREINFSNKSVNAISFLWDFGNGTTSNITSPKHTYTSPGVYDVVLIAQKGMCTDTFKMQTAVTIHSAPSVEFSYTKNNSCYPLTLSFMGESNNNVSWRWDFGDGFSDTLQNTTHTYFVKELFNVTLTVVDSNECSNKIIHQNEMPFQTKFEVGNTQGCFPKTVDFNNTSDSTISWFWDFGDETYSTEKSPRHTFQDTGSYNVSLIATSFEGCIDTFEIHQAVTVELLVAEFFSLDSGKTCAPLVSYFVDNSFNATSWFWNFGNGTTSDEKNPAHIFTTPGLYDISLVIEGETGCFDTIQKKEYIEVIGPIVNFQMSDSTGCDSVAIQFTNLSVDATSYEWYFGDGNFDLSINPLHIFSDTGNFSGILIAKDDNGCFDYIDLTKVVVSPSPIASFSVSDTFGCVPVDVSFLNNTLLGDNYTWDLGNANSSNEENVIHSYTEAGVYSIFLHASNSFGCEAYSDTLSIEIYPRPVADFSIDTSNHCFPMNVDIMNLTEKTHRNTYVWDFGDGSILTGYSPTHYYEEAGQYDVFLTVTNQYNCETIVQKEKYLTLNDSIAPEEKMIYVATVNENNTITITWEQSEESDFSYYVLRYKKTNDTDYISADTIYQRQNRNYVLKHIFPHTSPYDFKIKTNDVCGNTIDENKLNTTTSIHLKTRNIGGVVNLTWTSYEGCDISGYEIRRRKVNQEFERIAFVSNQQKEYTDTSFLCEYEYEYKVAAKNVCLEEHEAWSNISRITPINKEISTQTIEMTRSTVVENAYILIEWKAPVLHADKVVRYEVKRAESAMGSYEKISETPGFITYFEDFNVDVANQNYFYKIELINECDVQTISPNISSSILLLAVEKGNIAQISWTSYIEWTEGVEKYIIEKQTIENLWEKVKEVDGNSNTITDKIID
jgi:PKD repeat protein